MTDIPSDRAIAQALTIESECRDLSDVRASAFVKHVLGRARTLDAAPADPVVSAECWRIAIADYFGKKFAEAIERLAIELAREGK